MKEINTSDTIFDLVTKHPELKEVLLELGFVDIIKPGMLNTAGRLMTLSKGSKLKKIPMEVIVEKLESYGYIMKED